MLDAPGGVYEGAKRHPVSPRPTRTDAPTCWRTRRKGSVVDDAAYKRSAELLDRMCLDAATKDGLLDYDARCAKRGAKLKVVDVHGGKVCRGEVSKETMQQKSERLLRIAVKIAEVTTTPRRCRRSSRWPRASTPPRARGVLRKLFGYVYSLLSLASGGRSRSWS